MTESGSGFRVVDGNSVLSSGRDSTCGCADDKNTGPVRRHFTGALNTQTKIVVFAAFLRPIRLPVSSASELNHSTVWTTSCSFLLTGGLSKLSSTHHPMIFGFLRTLGT